ncbi:MAG: PspC domain-containing protein [Eubacterium sp.]|nr:PspC domain-containing protein [Eubacterium sp.]
MDKRLYKSSTNRVLFGVCGGIGEYFNIDPTIVRLLFILLVFGAGSGLAIYFVAALIMPDEPRF